MKNIKSILVIAALAFVTTTSSVSFATNKVNVKKVDSCTATVKGTGSDGTTYTATATRATCAEARAAAKAMIP